MRFSTSLKTIAVLAALLWMTAPDASISPLSLSAQETESQPAETTPETTRKKPRGRVPNHYGKLGLTSDQKEEIYAIQAKYRDEITTLQEQINELQQEEASGIYLVLSELQKESLRKVLAEVSERRNKK